jgi:predicted small secreted protein
VKGTAALPHRFSPAAQLINRNTIMLRKFILAIALGSTAFAVTACNTVKGLGNDIESVGEAGD